MFHHEMILNVHTLVLLKHNSIICLFVIYTIWKYLSLYLSIYLSIYLRSFQIYPFAFLWHEINKEKWVGNSVRTVSTKDLRHVDFLNEALLIQWDRTVKMIIHLLIKWYYCKSIYYYDILLFVCEITNELYAFYLDQ